MISQLPRSLKMLLESRKQLDTLKQGVKEWSKLVAWSWLDDFFVFSELERTDEKFLKECFIKTVKNQSKFRNMYITYGIQDALNQAEEASDVLKNLLNGEEIGEDVFGRKLKFKLSDVLKEMGHKHSVFTLDTYKQFFTYEITVDSHTGILSEDPNHKENYICTLAYPPCPAFGAATVTREELTNWMKNNQSGEYTPPSPYIPLSSS